MRRGKRKIKLSILLVLVVLSAFLLTACGDDAAGPSDDQDGIQGGQVGGDLSLEPSVLELEVGDEYTLKAVYADDKPLVWQSSNEQVASVDNGKVVGLRTGQTVVTVSCGGKKKTCTVTVKEKEPSLVISQAEYAITIGETVEIGYECAVIDPKTVVFSSSAPDIVGVDEQGRMLALQEGEAEIYAEAEGLKASCRVKVLPQAMFIYLSHNNVYMRTGEYFSLSVSVEPSAASQILWWKSSDPSVATVSEKGEIKAIGQGFTLITAKARVGDAYSFCEVHVGLSDSDGGDGSTSPVLTPGQSISLGSVLADVGATDHSEVLWESSDPLVALVDEKGIVTAGGYGIAVITVTHLETGERFECTVSVEVSAGSGNQKPLVDLPKIMLDVPYINQLRKVPTGCECASTVMVLKYWGFDISLSDFIDTKLDLGPYPYYVDGVRRGPNPWITFPGNPKSDEGYGCFAPAIVLALQKVEGIENYTITYGYSAEKSKETRYIDIEGANFVDTSNMTVADLCTQYLANGMPVIFWGGGIVRSGHVMYFPRSGSSWYIDDTDEKFRWIAYEHCLTLVGCDSSYYYFNDPIKSAKYKYTRASVEKAFAAVYSQFVVLSPNKAE